jgi:hypothetical protein
MAATVNEAAPVDVPSATTDAPTTIELSDAAPEAVRISVEDVVAT